MIQLLSLETAFSALIVKLRSSMNTLSPVNKLPPETLSQIFSYVSAPNSVAAVSGFDIPRSFREWAAVTRVCRYWREAAVASPNLWSKIGTPQRDLTELFLSRSAAHPLEVYAFPPPRPHRGPPFLEAFLPHLNRLKTLSFQMSQRVYGTDYILAEVAVPSLERLWISATSGDLSDNYPIDWISRLFTGNSKVPRLQHLCLSYVPFTSPFKFDNLSHLHFYHVPSLETQLPMVLESLACNPNLRELLLSQRAEITDIDLDLQPLPKPHIPLHSLQKLRVMDMSPPAITYLLSALKLEENGLALHFSYVPNTTNPIATIFPPTFPNGLSIFGAAKVELDSTGHRYAVVQATGPASSVRIETTLPYRALRSHAARLLEDHHPCPHVVKELWIHAHYDGDRSSLKFIPRSQVFPNLEVLVIKALESAVVDELCSAIKPEVKYPQLSTLVVYIPCWTFPDFCKFAEVLRYHHPKLRTVRVGAVVWVDLEAAVKVFKNIAEEKTLTIEVDSLNLDTDFGGMELPEICAAGDVTWWQWSCGIHTEELEDIEQMMQEIFSEEKYLDRWS